MSALSWSRLVFGAVVAFCSAPAAIAQPTSHAVEKDISYPTSLDGKPGEGPISDSPKFKELWIQRRGKWLKRVDAEQGALVFLGDSITQGWGDDLRGFFTGHKLANRGISGDTTRGVLIRLDDVIELNPSGVVMLIGTNDLARKATPEMVARNVERILEKLHEHNPELPIVLCAVFPSAAKLDRPKEKITEVNRLLAEAVKGDDRITFIDTYTLFADDQGDAKPEEFPDLLHPNKSGYAKWAAKLRPVLEERGLLNEDSAE
jgi:lysophospholipase L1-like esterase